MSADLEDVRNELTNLQRSQQSNMLNRSLDGPIIPGNQVPASPTAHPDYPVQPSSFTPPPEERIPAPSANTPVDVAGEPRAAMSPDRAVSSRLDAGNDVENRITRILGRNSPLLEQARQRALRAANHRGLLNSSLAVGEAEEAAIRQAMPIAQQDSAQHAESSLSGQRFEQDSQLNLQQYQQDSRLSHQGFVQTSHLSRQEHEQQRARAAAASRRAANLSAQEHEQAMAMLDQEYDRRTEMLDAEYGNRATEALSGTLSNIQNTLLGNIAQVQQNTDLSPEQREAAIDNLQRVALEQMNSQYALHGMDLVEFEDIAPAGPIADTPPASEPVETPAETAERGFSQAMRAGSYQQMDRLIREHGDNWSREQMRRANARRQDLFQIDRGGGR